MEWWIWIVAYFTIGAILAYAAFCADRAGLLKNSRSAWPDIVRMTVATFLLWPLFLLFLTLEAVD